jgi:hypothetical protein
MIGVLLSSFSMLALLALAAAVFRGIEMWQDR